jgi:protein-tyrosine-phosphatase
MPSVLFVCTANRSRSPVAAAIFKRELTSRNLESDWRVASAGTWTTDGLPATPDALSAARQMGLDLSSHRSSTITAQAIHDSDLVVVMEQGQKEALTSEFPDSARKFHLLGQLATGAPFNVPDPAGSPNGYTIYAEIAELVHKGFDRLSKLASGA